MSEITYFRFRRLSITVHHPCDFNFPYLTLINLNLQTLSLPCGMLISTRRYPTRQKLGIVWLRRCSTIASSNCDKGQLFHLITYCTQSPFRLMSSSYPVAQGHVWSLGWKSLPDPVHWHDEEPGVGCDATPPHGKHAVWPWKIMMEHGGV